MEKDVGVEGEGAELTLDIGGRAGDTVRMDLEVLSKTHAAVEYTRAITPGPTVGDRLP